MEQSFEVFRRSGLRQFSDDYDHVERCICVGEDYTVRVGDVSFRVHHHKNYDATAVSMFVDGQRVGYKEFDKPAEWEEDVDVPALRVHVKDAAREMKRRASEWDAHIRARDARYEAEKAAKRDALKDRFCS